MFEIIQRAVHDQTGLVIEDNEEGWNAAANVLAEIVTQLSILLMLATSKAQSFQSDVAVLQPPTLTKH